MLLDIALDYFPSGGVLLRILPVALLLWTYISSALIYRSRPKNVQLRGRSLLWGKWRSTIDFIFRASDRIDDLYQRSSHRPFAFPALREFQVLVSSPEHVQEVARCPESTLSFHNAMKERLRHKTTMMGFEHNDIDPDEYVTIQVTKVHLRKNLCVLKPVIEAAVAQGFESTLQGATQRVVSIFDLVTSITGRVNNIIFFGNELCQNKEFSDAAIQYPWHGSMTAEFCRYLPCFMVPVVGGAMMAWFGSMSTVERHLTQLVEERTKAHVNGLSGNYVDVTQFVIMTSRTPRQRSQRRMVQLIAGLLFAVSLTLPMALYWNVVNLCKHPELVKDLRKEISAAGRQNLRSLHLLDCFLRETGRLNPPDSLAVQRKVMQPFTLSDGTHIPAGNLVGVPQRAVMRDGEYYEDANRFDPYRFYTAQDEASSQPLQRFTDVKDQYLFWGAKAKSCPGRWYASDVLKQALVHLLGNYDFELEKPSNCEPLRVTTALVPRPRVRVVLTRRGLEHGETG